MSHNDTNLYHLIVPRLFDEEFRTKYKSVVETFYHVTLNVLRPTTSHDKSEYLSYAITFNLNPNECNISPAELTDRIQKYVEQSMGWAGERGEDSSYDSECDDEGSHRTASRTPSDTLAAEFAEYVTITPTNTPQHQAKIDFAVKLGYSANMARAALQKLGPDPPRNEFLAELIKMASLQPPRPLSPPSSPVEQEAAGGDRPQLRNIVIDGSNVAMSHGNKEVFSCRGIEICVEWFRARGHKEITVFIPKWRKEASRPDNPVADRDALERLERDRVLVYTPSRLISGKRLICYDDRYILRLAADTDGIVVSNDNYRDLAVESPEFKKVIEERLLMYSFVNDRFMPPEDPLGRAGPTLDTFLKAPVIKTEPPPACPYGKKCTYGNKCKFHHPERAGRPHKSVAEKLSERAARTIKSRDLHTLSLPPGGRPSVDNKQPLARAHSAAPRLPDLALAKHFDTVQQHASHSQHHPPHQENTHRKLARQLTLNPACDPRLHAPAMRLQSAPVGAAGHLSNMGGAAGAMLAARPSEGSLHHWEARQRMRFHLAGIFPEAQVVEAMAANPDETDAQTMCAVILARSRPPPPRQTH